MTLYVDKRVNRSGILRGGKLTLWKRRIPLQKRVLGEFIQCVVHGYVFFVKANIILRIV